MSKTNVVNDLGTLLRIPAKTLNELTDKLNLCIGSIISEAVLKEEKSVVINIGIGTLSIDLLTMQCKFIPSKNLKSTIKLCLTNKSDPLESYLEEALAEKLITICNEVF